MLFVDYLKKEGEETDSGCLSLHTQAEEKKTANNKDLRESRHMGKGEEGNTTKRADAQKLEHHSIE